MKEQWVEMLINFLAKEVETQKVVALSLNDMIEELEGSCTYLEEELENANERWLATDANLKDALHNLDLAEKREKCWENEFEKLTQELKIMTEQANKFEEQEKVITSLNQKIKGLEQGDAKTAQDQVQRLSTANAELEEKCKEKDRVIDEQNVLIKALSDQLTNSTKLMQEREEYISWLRYT